MRGAVLCAAGLLAAAAGARAAPVPPAVAAMIDAAAGDPAALKTVADLAKKTNPDSVAEIDAQLAGIEKKNEEARLAKIDSEGVFEGWKGEGQLGAFGSTGNTDQSGIAAGLKLSKETRKWKHTLAGTVDYQKTDGVTTAERFFAGYDGNYKITPRLYAVGILSWERDTFAGYDSRFSESLGLGYRLVDTPSVTLALEGGPALRQTSYTDGTSDSVFNGRLAGNFAWKFSPNGTFTQVASYFFGNGGNTVTSDTAITMKVWDALSLRLSFFLQNESEPQPGRLATDTTTRITVVYGF